MIVSEILDFSVIKNYALFQFSRKKVIHLEIVS